MAVATLESIAVIMKLNNGVNHLTGNINTVPVSLGELNPNTYDQDKVLAVTEAVEACLSKTINSVIEVRTSELVAD